jgi:hypothetical protein
MSNGTIVAKGPQQTAVFAMIAQKHALKLEILGMRHSSGRSVYAHIKRTYGLSGSKQKVLEQFTELIEREHDHWYDVYVNGALRDTLYGTYKAVFSHALGYNDDGPAMKITMVRRRDTEQLVKDLENRKRK